MTENMPDTFTASVRPAQALFNVLSAMTVIVFVSRSRRTRWLAFFACILVGTLGAPFLTDLRSLIGV